ncbi:unnamed protein product [Spirodela intermedia]|uniref:BZIP domain-containing protein n=1 Tax=Spirodela intermedia TaxID=51605 RepID=A0A7I8L2K6_SPIIN|nr:unnamed protein product [Spirodela intermedia]
MEPGGDGGVATKPPAPANPAQRTSADSQTTSPTYPDWASAMQVFYAGGPAASGTPQVFYSPPPSLPPFVWGTQPLTYETPIPHGSMFPHGGACAHPAALTSETVANGEKEAKPPEGTDSGPTKASDRGPDNGGMGGGSSADVEKGTSGSDTCNESGGEESSKTSREDDLSASAKGGYDQIFPVSLALSFPAASSHDGVHPWSSFCAGIGNMEKQGILLNPATAMNGQKKPVPDDFKGMQDEHEEKRQKRKQSNRESARRSRERRQKECEGLARQVAALNTHNADLRSEIDQLYAECKRIGAENASITVGLSLTLRRKKISWLFPIFVFDFLMPFALKLSDVDSPLMGRCFILAGRTEGVIWAQCVGCLGRLDWSASYSLVPNANDHKKHGSSASRSKLKGNL